MNKKTKIMNILSKILENIKNIYIVGSIARGNENPNDIDFVTTTNLNDLALKLEELFSDNILFNIVGAKRLNCNINDINVDVWFAQPYELNEMLVMRTIDKGHAIAYRKKAKQLGYKLNDYGLFDENDDNINFKNENELREILNIKNK